MKSRYTQRGFALTEFTDRSGVPCALQESSADGASIWFGVTDTNPIIMASDARKLGRADLCTNGETTGFVKWPVPKEVLFHDRMHLTQEQVKALLPALQHFAETGSLPPPPQPELTDEDVDQQVLAGVRSLVVVASTKWLDGGHTIAIVGTKGEPEMDIAHKDRWAFPTTQPAPPDTIMFALKELLLDVLQSAYIEHYDGDLRGAKEMAALRLKVTRVAAANEDVLKLFKRVKIIPSDGSADGGLWAAAYSKINGG